MQHNFPPSQFFNKGATYGHDTMILVAPDGSKRELSGTHLPKIARGLGDIAAKEVGVTLPRIARVTETPRQSPEPYPQYTAATDLHSRTRNAYAGPAERQAAIESASVQSVIDAAVASGINVDQWKASRHNRG